MLGYIIVGMYVLSALCSILTGSTSGAGSAVMDGALAAVSFGVFYRSDYPNSNDAEWRRNIIIRKSGSGMELSVRDAVKNINF